MKVDRNDVAKAAGVSPTTVSFVLNNKDVKITSETRKKVKEVAKKLGYVPNRIAQALKTGKSKIITLWVYSLVCPYTNYVINAFLNELNSRNYEIIVKEKNKNKNITFQEELYCDGIISFDCYDYFTEYIEKTNYDIPIVNGGCKCNKNYDYVALDLVPGIDKAFKSFEKYKKIGYVTINTEFHFNSVRQKIYREFIAKHNLQEYIVKVDEQFDKVFFENDLDKYPFIKDMDAIFCFNDNIALRTIGYLHKCGINVPKDIKIIGHDNLEIDEFYVPNLSSVKIPIQEMCKTLTDYIIDRIESPNNPIKGKQFYTEFIERESSK